VTAIEKAILGMLLNSAEKRELDAKWHAEMREGRRMAFLARHAMPRDVRPTCAMLARGAFATARRIRLWSAQSERGFE
jgi:hypothetical protein